MSARPLQLHLACVLWPLVWVPACYAAWVGKGCRAFMPFLSDFDTMMPESALFTLGASVQGLLMLALVLGFQAHQHAQLRHRDTPRVGLLLHRISAVPGVLAAVSCTGLAWAPWNTSSTLHRVFAYQIFGGGLLWGVCAALGTWLVARGDRVHLRALATRLAWSTLGLASLLSMSAITGRVFTSPTFDHEAYIARSFDTADFCRAAYDPSFAWAALCEWLLLLALLGGIWTLRADLRKPVGAP